MIRIEFDDTNKELAECIGEALTRYGSGVREESDKPAATLGAIEDWGDGTSAKPPTAAELEEKAGATLDTTDAGSDENGLFTEDEEDSDPANVDENRVPFHADYCAKAVEPFYKSGPHAGQWKRKKGVEQSAYDSWYADALAVVKPSSGEQAAEEPVDTSAAFQSGDGGQAAEELTTKAPHDAGTLMAWVAEMQGADRLNQEQVNAAYTQANLSMPDIFPSPDNTSEVIAERVGTIHSILASWT